MVEKAEYLHEEMGITGSRHVTVEGGRHVIYSEEGREAMNFWEAAGAGQKLFAYVEDAPDDEEEDEQNKNYAEAGHELNYGDRELKRPNYLNEEWVKEKLFPYMKRPEEQNLRAVMDTINDFYHMDFSLKDLVGNMDKYPGLLEEEDPELLEEEDWKNKDSFQNKRIRTARLIMELATVVIYEDMCSEQGRFAGFERADLFLQAASKLLPDEREESNGRTWKRCYENMQKKSVETAKNMFMFIHPVAGEFCNVCVTDRKLLMDAARNMRAKEAAEFAASLPEDLKETVEELKKVSSLIGVHMQYRGAARPTLRTVDGNGNLRTFYKKDFPDEKEMPELRKREKELRATALAKMHTHGIKGTVWPLVETQCIDVAAMDREKQEMLDRAKEKAATSCEQPIP